MALLNKASKLDIKYICPLHGVVWRSDISYFVDKYIKWGSYQYETSGVVIIYGSIYGNTANAANILGNELRINGVKNVAIFDASKTDVSYLLSECFRYSHIVFASATYNLGIFTKMENLLFDLKAHLFQNRTVGIIENGSWAPSSDKLMKELLCSMKDITVLEPTVTISSAVKSANLMQLKALASQISQLIE